MDILFHFCRSSQVSYRPITGSCRARTHPLRIQIIRQRALLARREDDTIAAGVSRYDSCCSASQQCAGCYCARQE